MLTADLVRARKKAGELQVVPIDKKARAEAVAVADELLALASAQVGATREELDEALGQVSVRPAFRRVYEGLRKLVDDRCTFELTVDVSPEELRREVFLAATERRRALAEGDSFDRDAVLTGVASARDLSPADVERGLYADLRGAHVLQAFTPTTADALVDEYDTAQAQAVLLRAVRVVAEVSCGSSLGYRALFSKLKFLRLLYAVTPLAGGGYRVAIDGPFSMFESVTKYGLQLALCLPAIRACRSWRIEADVRWGREREALVFKLAGEAMTAPIDAVAPVLSPEVEALAGAFAAFKSPWRVSATPAILDLPGVGLCVPDLLFEHGETGERVFLEVMGYWSREAVWKRIDLIQKGMREKLLVAVSERLRVSEDALEAGETGALYVYKGSMNPRAVLRRLDELIGRPTASNPTLALALGSARPAATEATSHQAPPTAEADAKPRKRPPGARAALDAGNGSVEPASEKADGPAPATAETPASLPTGRRRAAKKARKAD